MRVDEHGKLEVISRMIGRKKALHTLVENMFEHMDLGEDDPIFISHGDCAEDVEYVKGLILTRLPKARVETHYIGAVIGAHAGVGTVAIFHKGKQR